VERASTASEPGRFRRALDAAKKLLLALASFGARAVAEHEIDALLDLIP
jgi:hypothetical protein